MKRIDITRSIIFTAVAAWWIATLPTPTALAQISYNRDIRPILAENCFVCHGPDATQRAVDLRLDERPAAIDFGAIVPGDPSSSPLIERIRSRDPDLVMPPPDSRKSLTDQQRDLLEQWIAAGASYEMHWAYLPPRRPEVPPAKHPHLAVNAIDHFVQHKLADQNLIPAPEADQETLARRVYLDLIGLPPTPEQLLELRTERARWDYEGLVERLLASPHFGERLASGWLDVVRYADTVGYHGDQNQNVFPYRDWVIEAFNSNMPFDEFTRMQLAGDLLPDPAPAQLVATCFNRLNMMTREGGAQPEEYLAKYSADRVRTVSGAWLGSTVGCAECHDHKYDPFTTKDFYQLAAFFADIRQWGVYQDYNYTPNPDLRGWSNDHPFPPEIEVDVPYLAARQKRLIDDRRAQSQEAVRAILDSSTGRLQIEGVLDQWRRLAQSQANLWLPVQLDKLDAAAEFLLNTAEQEPALSSAEKIVWQVTGKNTSTLELVAQPTGAVASLRWQWVPHSDFDQHIFPKATTARDIRLSLEVLAEDGKTRRRVPVHFADSQTKLPRYANGFEIQGIHSAWMVPNSADTVTGIWILEQPLELQGGEKLIIKVTGNQAQRFSVCASPLVPLDADQDSLAAAGSTLLALAKSTPSPESSANSEAIDHQAILLADGTLVRSLLLTLPDLRSQLASQRRLDREIRDCRGGRWPVLVTESQSPLETRVLPRGNWQDKSGEVVAPAFPGFLTATSTIADKRLTRLDLANWLVAAENPLTARVQVNRWWKHFLGQGLSPVLDDLGIQGQYPSHPELLDWLAVEFRESGWNMKHLIKLIVLSHTYRQSTTALPQAITQDPGNHWLSHQNSRRLEAEIVRDQALAIAGLICVEQGGPPVFPYQPERYYKHLQFPDRDYVVQRDERQFRRSVYMHWQRTFLHPMLANFDAPPREECTALRTEANTPQQALTLLNDPSFVHAALELGKQVLDQPLSDDTERVAWMYQRVLSRAPQPNETQSLVQFVAAQRTQWRELPEDCRLFVQPVIGSTEIPLEAATELATWGSVARALLNLHETITRY